MRQALAAMFRRHRALPMPVIARVHGAALGGGAGLAAVSDIVVATDTIDVRLHRGALGILPATIAPFVIRRSASSAARELFLTGTA